MSASMAEVLAKHPTTILDPEDGMLYCANLTCRFQLGIGMHLTGSRAEVALAAHQEAMLAANGYGKLEDAWEAGRRAGYDAGSRWARTGEDKDTPNPHRRPE